MMDSGLWLHQLTFGLVDGPSTREMTVLETSFPAGSPEPDSWHERLKAFYRLTPTAPNPPDHALSYLEFPEGDAAVLWRSARGLIGRGFSRAVVGPAAVLSPLATDLDDWLGDMAAAPLQPVATTSLNLVPPPVDIHTRVTAIRVLAALLAEPARGMTVIGAELGAELGTVRLLRRALDPIIGSSRSWTFSTYETDDDANRQPLPAMVFVPELPTTATKNCRVHLIDAEGGGDHAWLAAELLQSCSTLPDKEYARMIQEWTGGATDPGQRIDRLRGSGRKPPATPAVGSHRLLTDDASIESINHAAATDPELATTALPLVSDVAPSVRAQARPQPWREWPSASLLEENRDGPPAAVGVKHPTTFGFPRDPIRLLKLVEDAADEAQFQGAVAEIHGRITTTTPEQQTKIRSCCMETGFLARKIERSATSQQRIHAFLTVLQYAYGPSGCELVAPGRVRQLARALIHHSAADDLVGAALDLAANARVGGLLHEELSREQRSSWSSGKIRPYLVELSLPRRVAEPARRVWLLHRDAVLAYLLTVVVVAVAVFLVWGPQ